MAKTERFDACPAPFEDFVLEVTSGPDAGRRCTVGPTMVVGTGIEAGFRLNDSTVSRAHLQLSRVEGGIQVVDAGSSNGTFIGGARTQAFVVAAGASFSIGRTVLRLVGMRPEESAERFGVLETRNPAMARLFRSLASVSKADTTLLLLGETGVGKTTLARATHDASLRATRAFVTIDCASISPELLESELFGHLSGSFSGAVKARQGLFAQAAGGTVFLDEVAELPLSAQTRLLRVLETRAVRAVGADEETAVDFRLIAATHRDLERLSQSGAFRPDLYFRLSAVSLRVPPLRERREDLPGLIDAVMRSLGREPWALPDALRHRLLAHEWVGNVRELHNVIESSLLVEADARASTVRDYKREKEALIEVFTREYFAMLYRKTGGNVSELARQAGVARPYAHELLKKYRIS